MDNVELPRWLPNVIQKAVKNEFDKNPEVEKWRFIRPLFENDELKSDWNKISIYPAENINLFISQIFNLPNNWEEKLIKMKKVDDRDTKVIKDIKNLIKAKEMLNKSMIHKDNEVERSWDFIESRLKERLFVISKKHDPKYADHYLSLLNSPFTRKKKIDNAHEIYCMRSLVLATRVIFGKPLNDIIANFINQIFNKNPDVRYSYDDIISYTKDVKNIDKKLQDASIPFALNAICSGKK